jgi:hypothetical protein
MYEISPGAWVGPSNYEKYPEQYRKPFSKQYSTHDGNKNIDVGTATREIWRGETSPANVNTHHSTSHNSRVKINRSSSNQVSFRPSSRNNSSAPTPSSATSGEEKHTSALPKVPGLPAKPAFSAPDVPTSALKAFHHVSPMP